VLVIADANVGRVFLGKWHVRRRLGQGGMGTVYLAEDLAVGREVALKFLHPALAHQEEYRTRFVREAKVMGQVEHPNIVSLYGVEQDGELPFLVMRFVRGAVLTRLIERGPLSLEQALPLIAQLTAALSALHARGFVHRDLKPGNVMLGDDGHVTVLDFGLTRGLDTGLTRPGVTLGSPAYMSPEQVTGSALDARSDVYALALITSELLVGHRPFLLSPGADAMQAHLFAQPERADVGNASVPRAVADVLERALQKRPAERYPSVLEFFEALLTAANPEAATRLAARQERPAVLASLAQSVPHLPQVAEVLPPTASAPTPRVDDAKPTAPARRTDAAPRVPTSGTEPDLPPAPEAPTGADRQATLEPRRALPAAPPPRPPIEPARAGPVPKSPGPLAPTVLEPRATEPARDLSALPTNPSRPAPFRRRLTPWWVVAGLAGLAGLAAWRWL
jgi:serine/threonine protein kinase